MKKEIHRSIQISRYSELDCHTQTLEILVFKYIILFSQRKKKNSQSGVSREKEPIFKWDNSYLVVLLGLSSLTF